uniref:Uncharacterized protein n=1 Tax=Timema cristinae TaxID=61476 RepID=A0A7R9DSS1_TIMCR|nr:unnamed protein product [Timema cristinae]
MITTNKVGTVLLFQINSNGAPSSEILVQARSPTGRSLPCPVQETDGVYTATFQPDEPGEWNIAVTHGGEHIQGGPFVCFVFNPNGVKVTHDYSFMSTGGSTVISVSYTLLRGLDVPATPGQPFSFTMDTSATGGLGDVVLDVVHSGHSLSHHKELLGGELYKVTFTPNTSGKYRIYVYFNGTDIRGSPFSVRVGSSGQRSRDKSNSPMTRNLTSQQYVSSASYSSPVHHQEDSRWSKRQTGSPNYLVTESRSSMERMQLSDERGGSPARMVNGRGPSPMFPRERISPVTKKVSESRSPSQSPTAFKQFVNVRRGSVDLLEDRNIVDTSSNVRGQYNQCHM